MRFTGKRNQKTNLSLKIPPQKIQESKKQNRIKNKTNTQSDQDLKRDRTLKQEVTDWDKTLILNLEIHKEGYNQIKHTRTHKIKYKKLKINQL